MTLVGRPRLTRHVCKLARDGLKAFVILVADDEPDVEESLALNAVGHQTVIAYDGRQAIEAAKAFGPTVVILDLDMPVMDGLTAGKVLAELELQKGRPYFIASSGNLHPDVREQTIQAGFNFYMAKPPDVRVLLSIVETVAENL